jgi:hypothetical protein
MGTRNLICIYYKGRFMVAQYTQWDGYLEGQGWAILQFLLVPGNIQRLKAGMEFITVVDDDTVRQMGEGHEYNTYDRFGQRVCQCGTVAPISGPSPCVPSTLSRDTGSKLFEIIASARSDSYIPFLLSLEFATDGQFCEYCYCVDLDADTFELFGGHTRNVKSEDGQHTEKFRFSAVSPDAEWTPNFLKAFSFAELPKDLDDMLAKVTADNPANVEYEVDGEKDDEDDEKDDKKTDKDDEKDDE